MTLKNLIKKIIVFALILFAFADNYAQKANGSIYADTNNLIIVKVQGTHYERGYAQGEILGNRITDLLKNYIIPQFGNESDYNLIRDIVAEGDLFIIDSLYIVEAKGLIDGMNTANANPEELDYVDVLILNTLLEIYSVILDREGIECSSFMSWGSATETSADLQGKSIITRHIDWEMTDELIRNQVMVIHIPSEDDEQPWAQIGFAGMISALSGFNSNIAVFQHMMGDDNSHGVVTGSYEPIWFSLRKSIEKKDPNGDGASNINDVKYVINQQSQGYADGFIISALARSTEIHDSLIAMVAEVAAEAPLIVYRSNAYPDSIPNDNLYTANNQIARNNSMHFCSRYNGIKDNIGDGDEMSLVSNRDLMRNYSQLFSNYQFMTFVPELDLFRVSVCDTEPAYLSPDMDFSISHMFEEIVSVNPNINDVNMMKIFPNPANNFIIVGTEWAEFAYQIFDISGKIVQHSNSSARNIDISNLAKGFYQIKTINGKQVNIASFIKK